MRLAWGLIAASFACAGAPPSTIASPSLSPTPVATATTGAPLILDIAAFNDFHGNIEPPSEPWTTADGPVPAGGAAYLAAHLARLRGAVPHLIVASAGDMIGASPLASAMLHDEPTIEAMSAAGVDLNTVGNHELDEGLDELLRLLRGGCHPQDGCKGLDPWPGARFVTTASNLWREGEKETVFPASIVKEVEGVKVGFIGLALSSTPLHQPVSFTGARFGAEAESANVEARRLRALGIEALIVVVHEGLIVSGDMNACDSPTGDLLPVLETLDPSIDVVLSGHTHRAYVCRIAGKLVTSAGSYGRAYTHLRLALDRKTGDVAQVLEAKNVVVDHTIAPDAKVAAIVARWSARAREVGDRVVGRVTATISRKSDANGVSPLGQLVADAQLFATRDAGAEIAIMHARGLRTDIVLAPGGVTFAGIASVHPFSNHLVTVTVRGEDLLAFIEDSYTGEGEPRYLVPSSTLSWVWSAAAPHIDPKSVRIAGKPVDPKREYRLTINDYLAGRGPLAKSTQARRGVTDAEALVRYFETKSPIAPLLVARVKKR